MSNSWVAPHTQKEDFAWISSFRYVKFLLGSPNCDGRILCMVQRKGEGWNGAVLQTGPFCHMLCEGLCINQLSSDCSHSPNSPCKKVKGCEKKGKTWNGPPRFARVARWDMETAEVGGDLWFLIAPFCTQRISCPFWNVPNGLLIMQVSQNLVCCKFHILRALENCLLLVCWLPRVSCPFFNKRREEEHYIPAHFISSVLLLLVPKNSSSKVKHYVFIEIPFDTADRHHLQAINGFSK